MKKLIPIFLLMMLLTGCAFADGSAYDLTFTDHELAGTFDAKEAVAITGAGHSVAIDGKGAAYRDGTLTISRKGTYLLSGEFNDVYIVVRVGDGDKVQLVLSGATLTNPDGPVLYIQQADKVFLTAVAGTDNVITDGSDYALTDGETNLDAAVFSRADLCLNGSGSLTVNGNCKHAIVSKDDLVLTGLTLTVNAASTALDGKDCVKLNGVNATLTAGTNGVRSDNAEDASRGFVYIQDGSMVITAGGDGIQAETLLQADNASLTITTGGGSSSIVGANSYSNRRDDFGGSWGGSFGGQSQAAEGSWKGLKAGQALVIHGGSYALDTADDCLHTNGDLTITGGLFTLASADDCIHADNTLDISGGEFVISKCYEGVEASVLNISGGTFDITSSDDGLNAAGGADGSSTGDRWGRGMFSNGVGEINISGGYIHINAIGDGIDSNNDIRISGGVTLVSGSGDSMNAAFDYDGEARVTGGVLFATGSSGMAQSFTSAENQGSMLFGINGATAGVNIAIVDASGRVVASFTPANRYSAVVVTAPGIQLGQTYSVVIQADVEGADANGFAQGALCTGGTELGAIEMTTALYGGSGHSMGGGPGGRTPGGGNRWGR